jgi:hypothetical protein
MTPDAYHGLVAMGQEPEFFDAAMREDIQSMLPATRDQLRPEMNHR